LGLDLDVQLLLEESLATDEEDLTAGVLRGVHGSLELDASIGLVLTVLSLGNLVGKSLKSLGLGKLLSGLVGGITHGSLDVDLAMSVLGSADDILDGVGASGLEGLLVLDLTLELVDGVQGVLLTQKSNSDDVLGGGAVLAVLH